MLTKLHNCEHGSEWPDTLTTDNFQYEAVQMWAASLLGAMRHRTPVPLCAVPLCAAGCPQGCPDIFLLKNDNYDK